MRAVLCIVLSSLFAPVATVDNSPCLPPPGIELQVEHWLDASPEKKSVHIITSARNISDSTVEFKGDLTFHGRYIPSEESKVRMESARDSALAAMAGKEILHHRCGMVPEYPRFDLVKVPNVFDRNGDVHILAPGKSLADTVSFDVYPWSYAEWPGTLMVSNGFWSVDPSRDPALCQVFPESLAVRVTVP